LGDVQIGLLPTTVIGSYPRPEWLKESIKMYTEGKINANQLKERMDDAALLVIKEHELAGVDIITDGEMRRDEMVEYFAERLQGFKFYGDVRVWGTAHYRKPAVVGRITYVAPLLLDEFEFTRSATNHRVKITITGPYTLTDWCYNEYYSTKTELAFDLARAVNQELLALQRAGADFIQIDEPALPTHPGEVEWAKDVFNEAVRGLSAKTAVHVCYGDYTRILPYADDFNTSQFALEFANRGFKDLELFRKFDYNKEIGLGVIDVHNQRVETPDEVASAIRRALEFFEPNRIYVNPDCGLKLLPKAVAFKKLSSMVKGASIVRAELLKR
jgi:5-methyltetrahydropteroyltriglutamate--homocysteine methyltransferase